MEENYSRGKRFGDKFWKYFETDVRSVSFLFLRILLVARAKVVGRARKYLDICVSGLEG